MTRCAPDTDSTMRSAVHVVVVELQMGSAIPLARFDATAAE
ncbi:MAG TPA: hypothetical protein VMT70_23310 [Vicinamibacteria bacterium]|nr:hypothetical protein [Vicinamibacteria bacterium]